MIRPNQKNLAPIAITFTASLLLLFARMYSYNLFHSLVELWCVVVAFGIFMVFWNSQKFLQDSYYLIIGVSYFFIGSLDLIHTLAYKGMGVLGTNDPNYATQLWIAARYMESISLLAAAFFMKRRFRVNWFLELYIVITAAILLSVFYKPVFSDCYIEGQGLTFFKKFSEFVISAILLTAAAALIRRRKHFDRMTYRLLLASMLLTVFSEISFTLYLGVTDIANMIGHFLKFISYVLIYEAFIKAGFLHPVDLLFQNLKREEQVKEELIHDLQDALHKVKTLSGLLPICANCKKIRDDNGYWQQVEVYIRDRSDAEFSHGICPDCMQKLYPDFWASRDSAVGAPVQIKPQSGGDTGEENGIEQ